MSNRTLFEQNYLRDFIFPAFFFKWIIYSGIGALTICKEISVKKFLTNGSGLENFSEKRNGLELYHL